ncbi:hypothetical protein KEM60_02844 [Austwickia sp. TVS 96-490-7B]|uniref:hypothetical protein n=1 Tax=Austwickia sp. TVS 96-490-7B TaxID=2830843 RepID=UPI001C597977|nr:hypothetical protein [Austwickia sp. TVS 96-490-7B]MBW3086615.1 hypothetical protein [Austwickia sp. TVS 96-490-7B]
MSTEIVRRAQRTHRAEVGRYASTVVIQGHDELTALVAAMLRQDGRCQVRSGPSMANALAWESPRIGGPDTQLAIVVAPLRVAPEQVDLWRRLGIPHLPVVYDAAKVVVGPLVLAATACLGCVDLHRADQDPSWSWQGGRANRGATSQGQTIPLDGSLAAVGAGLVGMVSRALLDRGRVLPGVSLEVTWPDPHIVRRRWTVHPACRCVAAVGTMGT